jgi:hypothetical protein
VGPAKGRPTPHVNDWYCTCSRIRVNHAVYLTYVMAEGDTVPVIVQRFWATSNDLMSVNDTATTDVAARDIITRPLLGELCRVVVYLDVSDYTH